MKSQLSTQANVINVLERFQFLLCVLVYRCLNGTAPPYLAETPLPVHQHRYTTASSVCCDVDTDQRDASHLATAPSQLWLHTRGMASHFLSGDALGNKIIIIISNCHTAELSQAPTQLRVAEMLAVNVRLYCCWTWQSASQILTVYYKLLQSSE